MSDTTQTPPASSAPASAQPAASTAPAASSATQAAQTQAQPAAQSAASASPAGAQSAPAVDITKLTLSPATQASVSRLVSGKAEVQAWTLNLENSLQADVDSGALSLDEASAVAAKYEVTAPQPADAEPEAKETTAEMNQAQVDAAAKASA